MSRSSVLLALALSVFMFGTMCFGWFLSASCFVWVCLPFLECFMNMYVMNSHYLPRLFRTANKLKHVETRKPFHLVIPVLSFLFQESKL